MEKAEYTQRIFLKLREAPSSFLNLQAFLLDKEAANLSPRSLEYYQQKLIPFLEFLAGRGVKEVEAISPNDIRAFLVSLKNPKRSPGGIHAYYRAIKAFCRWLYAEGEIESDVMARIRAPKVPDELLEPVSMDTVKAMLKVCNRKTELGARDYAVILALLDSGLRSGEFLALNVGDMNIQDGTLLVRKGKGGKHRVAFLSAKSRREILRYLKFRQGVAPEAPLWLNRNGKQLRYSGLRDIVRRKAKKAGVLPPSLHAFRRAFALQALRNQIDIYSLKNLMGHSSLTVLQRYLKQSEQDLREAHRRASPVGNLGLR